jgi:hypothetical protein
MCFEVPQSQQNGKSQRSNLGAQRWATVCFNPCGEIPGIKDDGSLDADALRRWVLEVRDLAGRADRLRIADLQIGELLAYAPPDAGDGAWPHGRYAIFWKTCGLKISSGA